MFSCLLIKSRILAELHQIRKCLLMQLAMTLNGILGTLVLFSALIAVSHAATDAELTEKYRFSKVLDGNNNYKLYWSFNRQEETISFAVRVGTTGWIGFGLSPDGQMFNSDVVIGWVDSTGVAHFHVCGISQFHFEILLYYFYNRIVILDPALFEHQW